MPRNFTHYNILLSCPADVIEDRDVIENAVEDVNNENAKFDYIRFDVKYWSKDVLFLHGSPQNVINESIVYDADLVIAIFGSRLGTPTEKYDSGTIEEIEIMIQKNKPVIVGFCESEITITNSTDKRFVEDLLKVKEFKDNYQGLYTQYSTKEQLKLFVKNQLRLFLSKIAQEKSIKNNEGMQLSFLERQNEYEYLTNASEIVFCARTGKSFLNGYFNHIKESLSNGGKFIFLTSEESDLLYDDEGEHELNRNNSVRVVRNLQKIANDRVECRFIDGSPNLTIVYIKTNDGKEYMDVKFNFQTPLKEKHPLLKLTRDDPYFSIFYNELFNIIKSSRIVPNETVLSKKENKSIFGFLKIKNEKNN